MIHILHVLPRMPIGGVGSFLINAQKKIASEKYSFDYLIFEDVKESNFQLTVKEMGARVFVLNDSLAITNAMRIQRDLDTFFSLHAEEFEIVHLHSANVGVLVFSIAKKYGIKRRVLHAHSTKYSDAWVKSIRNWLIEAPVKKYATNFIACGKSAGDFQFKGQDYSIVYNGIDTKKFFYRFFPKNERVVIGHVGNFLPVKNHVFLIKLLNELLDRGFNCEMWFAGTGPQEEKIKKMVMQYGLQERVKFLGKIENTEVFYNRINLFVLPSFYEGFPVSLMEAQACGTPIICSDKVTKEVDFYNDGVFLPISDNAIKIWANTVINFRQIDREKKSEAFQASKFTITSTTSHLEELYETMMER